jgi:hypothetical protein
MGASSNSSKIAGHLNDNDGIKTDYVSNAAFFGM